MVRHLLAGAVALALSATPALAGQCSLGDGSYVQCVVDPNNASYTLGVSSTAASGTFYLTGTSAPAAGTRGVKLWGPSNIVCQVTITGPNGNSSVIYGQEGDIALTWSGLTSGCTIEGLY